MGGELNTLFSWHCNPWRKYSWRWWLHWLDVKDLLFEIKQMWQRAHRGYADKDLWSIDMYLAQWLPAALQQFRETTHSVPMSLTSQQWEHELKMMEHAFIAAQHVQWTGVCTCWQSNTFDGIKHDAYWKRRWLYCSGIFVKRFFNLWD